MSREILFKWKTVVPRGMCSFWQLSSDMVLTLVCLEYKKRLTLSRIITKYIYAIQSWLRLMLIFFVNLETPKNPCKCLETPARRRAI